MRVRSNKFLIRQENNTASVRIAMKITDKTDKTVTIEMTHDQALMIKSTIGDRCFGGLLFHDEFATRVGYPRKIVGKIGSELYDLLYEVGISNRQMHVRSKKQHYLSENSNEDNG